MEKERLREKFTCCSEAVQMLPKLCPAPTNVWETELALKKVLCAVPPNSGNLLLLWTEQNLQFPQGTGKSKEVMDC